jgi:hypothetical protein
VVERGNGAGEDRRDREGKRGEVVGRGGGGGHGRGGAE